MSLLEKRTKKYMPLKDRLLSIKSNILQNRIIHLLHRLRYVMLCVYGNGCWKVKEKRVFLKVKILSLYIYIQPPPILD